MTSKKFKKDNIDGIVFESIDIDGSVSHYHFDKDDITELKKLLIPQCPEEGCKHYDRQFHDTDGCPYECCLRIAHDHYEPTES